MLFSVKKSGTGLFIVTLFLIILNNKREWPNNILPIHTY